MIQRDQFGDDFYWGVSTAAYQVEGAHDAHGKGLSIWDEFVRNERKIAGGHHARQACEFYDRYKDDVRLMKYMNIENFRFSLSWSRILPTGTGKVNQQGLDYYDRLVDTCLEHNIKPWITVYHWDLPHALEQKGGWTNRDIEHWFMHYTEVCAMRLGDRAKHWMVLNEPMVFTGGGYFLGIHAPGRIGLQNFLSSAHHATICQAQGGRILKSIIPDAQVGTTFSCSYIEPESNTAADQRATIRFDALLNRLFVEPALGMGYPLNDLRFLSGIQKYFKAGDEALMPFDFDFIGVQNYTREVVRHSWFIPFLHARIIKADKRGVKSTMMNWEVYPSSLYHMLKKYAAYPGIKKMVVTENGAAFADRPMKGGVPDKERTDFLQQYMKEVLRAKQEGIPVHGYFVWTLLDNFEWAEGYYPRFGLVYVDFKTQQRIIKESGHWYRRFLSKS